MALFVYYPKCSTCQKALKFLESNGLELEKRHIVEEVPTANELLEWMEKGQIEFKKFFNTSGMVYREMGLKERVPQMTKEEAAKLLSTNGMLIKRPILVLEDKVIVGFREKEYAALVQS